MQVNENGVLSFGRPYRFSHPKRFPDSTIAVRQQNVVAPFWSDNDIRKEGTVRYAAIQRSSSAEGNMLLQQIAARVNEPRSVSDDQFEPTFMVVAQWDKVHPFPHGSDSHEGYSEEYLNQVNWHQLIPLYILYTCVYIYYTDQHLRGYLHYKWF